MFLLKLSKKINGDITNAENVSKEIFFIKSLYYYFKSFPQTRHNTKTDAFLIILLNIH